MSKRTLENLVTVEGNTAEILIDEQITDDNFLADLLGWVSLKSFKEMVALAGDVDTYVFRILSPGGSVFAGNGIANYIEKLGENSNTIAEVETAASIATRIAIAANKVRMADNGHWMIHEARSGAFGKANEIEATAKLTRDANGNLLTAYADKTGVPTEQISEWMSAETWFTAEEALTAGFVDEVTGGAKALSNFQPQAFGDMQSLSAAFASLSASIRTTPERSDHVSQSNAAPQTAETPAATDNRETLLAGLKPYTEAFGAEAGLEYFEAGTSFEDALKAQNKTLTEELAATAEEVSTLKAQVEKLEAAKPASEAVETPKVEFSAPANSGTKGADAKSIWNRSEAVRDEFQDFDVFEAAFKRDPEDFIND